MKKNIILVCIVLFFAVNLNSFGRDYRVAQVPNGSKLSCNTCHTNGGGTTPNDFGKLVFKSFLVQDGAQLNVNWGPLLASLDADNDGVTNGQELQDPYGIWKTGDSAPGNASLVTSAGLNNSSPITTLTVNFNAMNPHEGQTLWLRVFDKNNMKEVGRTSVTVTETFSLTLDAIIAGNSYNIDFYSDHNGNGKYDTPPVDHAWRIELNNAQGSDIVEFTHNTNFIDIEWPFLLNIQFSGMTPHIGQLLEIRVEDDLTSEEIGRKRIESIAVADFNVDFPGIQINREYKVEMYADLNNNGIYDEPPTDHAWEVKFENNTGDYSAAFTHNTDFKDVGWKYLYTLNFVDLAPHVGQKLEMRVVKNDNGEEVSRTSITVPGPQFSLSIPQIEMDHDYNVEFYADHNGNGAYDAPPTDHAWRLSFNSSTGNFAQNFFHNQNFTDINWSDVTSVYANSDGIPDQFVLNQNYPNPFNPSTIISFNLADATNVSLKVFNVLGQQVTSLLNQRMMKGLHQVQFKADNLQSGTYYYRIETDNYSETRKMLLIK
jgi:hypothetical protein